MRGKGNIPKSGYRSRYITTFAECDPSHKKIIPGNKRKKMPSP